MHYVGISTYQFIPYHASAIHKHTHTRILKPFEHSEPTGLKVDIARYLRFLWTKSNVRICHAIYVMVLVCTEMLVCRYFVCWVEFDELYFSYLLKNA